MMRQPHQQVTAIDNTAGGGFVHQRRLTFDVGDPGGKVAKRGGCRGGEFPFNASDAQTAPGPALTPEDEMVFSLLLVISCEKLSTQKPFDVAAAPTCRLAIDDLPS
ncbi:MAG: hypothetical protein H6924_08975 [Alphaproteobacteria bacterium]|nr:hypothetical protein [Alphaproteobacteria bacterium]